MLRYRQIAIDCHRLLQIAIDCGKLRLYNAKIVYNFENLYTHFSFLSSLPYVFELVLLLVVRSTHSTIFNLIRFVLISRLRANNGLLLVIASIGLLSLLIYLTLAILRLLYNWCRHVTLIISFFSYIVPSLIRHL